MFNIHKTQVNLSNRIFFARKTALWWYQGEQKTVKYGKLTQQKLINISQYFNQSNILHNSNELKFQSQMKKN